MTKQDMDAETLAALNASIAKWEKNARVESLSDVRTASTDCPLCILYCQQEDDPSTHCALCPVYHKTGKRYCYGTPYWRATECEGAWDDGDDDGEVFRAAAREEVAFLKSLLPEAEQ